jgi:hypothetical protein
MGMGGGAMSLQDALAQKFKSKQNQSAGSAGTSSKLFLFNWLLSVDLTGSSR